jgi:hypothetical protein
MADTYSIEKLSGSTDGKAIKVTGISSAADVTVHAAVAGAGDIDLVTLYAVNQDADGEVRTLTLAWGGETDPDNLISVPVPCKVGPVLVCERLPIMNSQVIGAWADEANDVMIYGRVERVVNT